MASSDVELISSILERETACHSLELGRRAYSEFDIRYGVESACKVLYDRGEAGSTTFKAPSRNKKQVTFVYSMKASQRDVGSVIKEKTGLLVQHYNLSRKIGRHGENIVAEACSQLGYTEIETRKKKHGSKELGISKRDIDVWAKHPTLGYYQNIEVKNRHDPVRVADLVSVLTTTERASSRWNLDVRPALVAIYRAGEAIHKAREIRLPIVLFDGLYAPEEHRGLYDELNSRLALNAIITDKPTPPLMGRVANYLKGHQYLGSTT